MSALQWSRADIATVAGLSRVQHAERHFIPTLSAFRLTFRRMAGPGSVDVQIYCHVIWREEKQIGVTFDRPKLGVARSSAPTKSGSPNESKIGAEQEEHEMDDGSSTADPWCFDKPRPQQRHRNVGEKEIEQNAR